MRNPELIKRQAMYDQRRGERPVGISDSGAVVTLDQLIDVPLNKHVFTINRGWLLEIRDHHCIEHWHHGWDWYTQDREHRKALAKLTGGKLPGELYQVEILLQRWQSNGQTASHDGPFTLTTHAAIKTKDQLLMHLRHMPRPDLNCVLINSIHATHYA